MHLATEQVAVVEGLTLLSVAAVKGEAYERVRTAET